MTPWVQPGAVVGMGCRKGPPALKMSFPLICSSFIGAGSRDPFPSDVQRVASSGRPMTSSGVGTSPPHLPYHSTGQRPLTLRSTSSTICPMLISMLITTRQPGLSAASDGLEGEGKQGLGPDHGHFDPSSFRLSMAVRHTRLMVP
jgi:hypothetical protein